MKISDYLIRPVSTSTEPSGQYNLQLEAYNMAVKLINRMTQPTEPTVCDIDAILDEIQAEKKGFPPSADYYKALSKVYEIIIKHTKGANNG